MKFKIFVTTLIFLCSYNIFSHNQLQLNNKLILATKKRDLAGVQQAVWQGADIHVDNDRALLIAAAHGDLSIMIFLLELPRKQRANIHADNDLALRCSVYGADLRAIKYLLRKGANIEVCNKYALPWVAEHGHWDVVACLLRYGADRTRLTTRQLKLMRNSLEAQAYIANEMEKALNKDDFSTIKFLEDIIPEDSEPVSIQLIITRDLCKQRKMWVDLEFPSTFE